MLNGEDSSFFLIAQHILARIDFSLTRIVAFVLFRLLQVMATAHHGGDGHIFLCGSVNDSVALL